jgi:hypothetical protein
MRIGAAALRLRTRATAPTLQAAHASPRFLRRTGTAAVRAHTPLWISSRRRHRGSRASRRAPSTPHRLPARTDQPRPRVYPRYVVNLRAPHDGHPSRSALQDARPADPWQLALRRRGPTRTSHSTATLWLRRFLTPPALRSRTTQRTAGPPSLPCLYTRPPCPRTPAQRARHVTHAPTAPPRAPPHSALGLRPALSTYRARASLERRTARRRSHAPPRPPPRYPPRRATFARRSISPARCPPHCPRLRSARPRLRTSHRRKPAHPNTRNAPRRTHCGSPLPLRTPSTRRRPQACAHDKPPHRADPRVATPPAHRRRLAAGSGLHHRHRFRQPFTHLR